MRKNLLPDYPHCGSSNEHYQMTGSSSSGKFHNAGFGCPCGSHFEYTSAYGSHMLVCFWADQLRRKIGDLVGEFPSLYLYWTEHVVLPTWRHREMHEAEEAKSEVLAWWDAPAGSIQHKMPPRVPPQLTVFVSEGTFSKDGWTEIKDSLWIASSQMRIPEDPALAQHKTKLGRIFSGLTTAFPGVSLGQISFIDNGYLGRLSSLTEPWVRWTLKDATFTMGPRKRVWCIQVDAPAGFSTMEIEPVATKDQVTYLVDGPLVHMDRDQFRNMLESFFKEENRGQEQVFIDQLVDSHPPDGKVVRDRPVPGIAHELIIHAWGLDKTLEYLILLTRAVLELDLKSEKPTP